MNNKNIINSKKKTSINFTKKLYVWSIVLEPFLFFIIFVPFLYKFDMKFSRILQIYIFVFLIIKILSYKNLYTIPNLLFSHYRYYFYYIILAFVAGIYGWIINAYTVTIFIPSYSYNFLRHFIEYFIIIYYFLYFVILFRYFIKKPEEIDYFFKIFSFMFFLCLSIGVLDLIAVSIFDDIIDSVIPRHIFDIRDSLGDNPRFTWTKYTYTQIGFRFHGLAGEPRDAFIFLILGLGILSLKEIWQEKKENIRYFYYPIIIISLFFTQSISGFLGLIFSIFLLIIFYLPKINFKNKLISIFFIFLTSFLISLFFLYNGRAIIYITQFSTIYTDLKAGSFPVSNKGIMVNIFPIWHRFNEIINLNLLPSFIGTGLGSSSIVNIAYLFNQNLNISQGELFNPHSSLIRTFYDTGFLGLLILTQVFIYPFKKFTGSKEIILKIFFWMMMILGAYYAHRSIGPYLYLGIALIICEKKLSTILKN